MTKKRTLKEIASCAGVSTATVSLVLNNKVGVGPEKRRQIQRLLDEDGYSSRLKKNILFLKYRTHGKLVEENQGFIASIFDAIERQCRVQGYEVSMKLCEHQLESAIGELDATQYCGVIVLGTELQPDQYVQLERIRLPYIVLDNNMAGRISNTVGIDNALNIREAFRLCDAKDVVYLKSSFWTANFHERGEAVAAVVKELGLDVRTVLLEPTLLGAYESMRSQLPVATPCFAFADNDIIALGAMKALQEAGYRIPEDCSIVGFDDIPFASISVPSLSTIRVPKSLIGAQAVEHIVKCMADADFRALKAVFSGTLVVRGSTRKS
jgi:LacI family transcriptional regulator